MNINIHSLRNQSLLTCGLAEEVVKKIRAEHKQEWLATRTAPVSETIAKHAKQAGYGIGVASFGLVSATGIAVAGGPAALGVTAFAIGAAAGGKAIYHVVAEKIARYRQELSANTSQAEAYAPPQDAELLSRAVLMNPAIWDEAISDLARRQPLIIDMPKPASRDHIPTLKTLAPPAPF